MSVSRIVSERNQKLLLELVAVPGNDVCADCKARNPRWASYSLGIFLCMYCASIHRKIGTHISKVKSLTMDAWTKDQVERMKEMGNLNSNAIYNPNETRHPPPPNMVDSERNSELEQYIRGKYEYKSFFDRRALVASKLGPSQSAASVKLSSTPSPKPPSSPNQTSKGEASTSARPSSAQPLVPQSRSDSLLQPSQPAPTRSHSTPVPPQSGGGVWNDLVSLQGPSTSSTLPLQVLSPQAQLQAQAQNLMTQPQPQLLQPQHLTGLHISPTPTGGLPMGTYPGSFTAYPQMQQPTGQLLSPPTSQAPMLPFQQQMSPTMMPQMQPFQQSLQSPQPQPQASYLGQTYTGLANPQMYAGGGPQPFFQGSSPSPQGIPQQYTSSSGPWQMNQPVQAPVNQNYTGWITQPPPPGSWGQL